MNHIPSLESTGGQHLDTDNNVNSDLEMLIEGADLARLKQAVIEFERRGEKSIVGVLRDIIRIKEMNANSTVDVETLTQLEEYFKQQGKSETDLKPLQAEIERKTVEDARFLATLEQNLKSAFSGVPQMKKEVAPHRKKLDALWKEFEDLRKSEMEGNDLTSKSNAESQIKKLHEIISLLQEIGQREAGVEKVYELIDAIQNRLKRKINRGASRQNQVRNNELVEAGV